MRRSFKLLLAVPFMLVSAIVANAADLKGWGIVVLHGKGGGPGGVASVASALKAAGATVIAPRMSWSGTYLTYDQTLSEVARQIASVKGRGVQRIALVGHSLGANVALGYAAQRGGVNAVVAMAPGHQPDVFATQTAEGVARAKAAVAAGRGNEVGEYVDINQGRVSKINVTAAAYASFFDPSGQAVISRNSGAGGAAVLWVVGNADPGARRVASGGTVVNVQAGHMNTVSAGSNEVVTWLEAR